MPYYHAERNAGKLGLQRESHRSELLITNFHIAPPPLASWDGTSGITQWGIDGNDQWSNCGAAAGDHYDIAKTGSLNQLNQLGMPKYQGTLPTYWAYGLAQGETGQPPNQPDQPDEGVDNATWCGWGYEQGLWEGYAECPLDLLPSYAPMFGGAILGVALSNQAQQDFESSPPIPWGSPGEVSNPQLGHDILYIAFHQDGSGEIVTWGSLQPITPSFVSTFGLDAWLIFKKLDDAARKGVDVNGLKQTLQLLHGQVAA